MPKTQNLYKKILSLSWPIIMSHMGHMMASVADSIMAGQLGKIPLAAVGLSNTIYAFFFLFGIGLSTGLIPLVSKAEGEGNEDQKKSLFKHGLIMNTASGIILSILMLALIPLLSSMGQPQEVITEAIPYYISIALSTIFGMLFFHFKQFGEGIQLVKTTMWVTIWGNLLNIFLNFVFIKGWFGIPELGSFGIGLATIISRILMIVALVISFNKSRMRVYIQSYSYVKFELKKLISLLKDCLPIAFQYIIEMSAFGVGAIMTGWFGSSSLAAHQIAMNISSITYLIAAGLGSATSILIGNSFGKKDISMLNEIIKKSTVIVLAIMATLTVFMILGRVFLPKLYIDDMEVVSITSGLLIVAAFFQLFDGFQVVGLGVLRGINDLKISTYIALAAYWVVAIPICYILSKTMELGALGVWLGFLAGLIVSSVLIYLRIQNRKKELAESYK